MSFWDELREIELWVSEDEGVFTRTRTAYRVGGRRRRTELSPLVRLVAEAGMKLIESSLVRLIETEKPDRRKIRNINS